MAEKGKSQADSEVQIIYSGRVVILEPTTVRRRQRYSSSGRDQSPSNPPPEIDITDQLDLD